MFSTVQIAPSSCADGDGMAQDMPFSTPAQGPKPVRRQVSLGSAGGSWESSDDDGTPMTRCSMTRRSTANVDDEAVAVMGFNERIAPVDDESNTQLSTAIGENDDDILHIADGHDGTVENDTDAEVTRASTVISEDNDAKMNVLQQPNTIISDDDDDDNDDNDGMDADLVQSNLVITDDNDEHNHETDRPVCTTEGWHSGGGGGSGGGDGGSGGGAGGNSGRSENAELEATLCMLQLKHTVSMSLFFVSRCSLFVEVGKA